VTEALVLDKRAVDCPHFLDHTPAPEGYLQWHVWAKRMMKTHKQRKCSGCGLYTIWEPRGSAALTAQGVAFWHANSDGSVSMIDPKDIWRHFCPYCGDELASPGTMYGCGKIECREESAKMMGEA